MITEITSNNKYKIKYGSNEYKCKSNEIYKTNEKKPSAPDYNIETSMFENKRQFEFRNVKKYFIRRLTSNKITIINFNFLFLMI